MTALARLSDSDARLPIVYEQARTAIAECEKIDECKDWADKAEALASYARQRDDDTLFNAAMRIKGRATRRCGELLKEIEPAPGKRTDREPSAGAGTRSRAAVKAGLSTRQRVQALRVASVPEEDFEELVERERPATVTELAKRGTRSSSAHLKGRDPKDFQASIRGEGALRAVVRAVEDLDPRAVARGALAPTRARMLAEARAAIEWLEGLVEVLEERR
jgi:hypothetical protein